MGTEPLGDGIAEFTKVAHVSEGTRNSGNQDNFRWRENERLDRGGRVAREKGLEEGEVFGDDQKGDGEALGE